LQDQEAIEYALSSLSLTADDFQPSADGIDASDKRAAKVFAGCTRDR
jgi:hypothetical protein